jgi:LuxR family transcriptional regulator, maltose regulon positive regulatory protein
VNQALRQELLALVEQDHAFASAPDYDPNSDQVQPQRLELLGRHRRGRTGSVIEIRALQALALHASGDQAAALAALAEALTLAAPEGHVRVFVDEGAPWPPCSARCSPPRPPRATAIRVLPQFLDRLLEAFQQADLPRSRRGVALPGLVAALSAREVEVPQLLAAGKSNPTIAEELVVTLDTVKRHVTHILDKLGVANRTQAVTRARELGVLR